MLSIARPGRPRALPSFPPRRSSDLQHDVLRTPERRAVVADMGRHARPADPATVGLRVLVVVVRSQRQPVRAGGDRKSTRLNSSHVKNSYAVFCWKRKKGTGRASVST